MRNQLQLGANILMNGVHDRVIPVGKAVSAATGKVSFIAAPDTSTGQSRVDDSGNSVPVECVALDDVISEFNRSLVIKMDIEDHELAAIAGMSACVANNRVMLQVECFPRNLVAVKEKLATMDMRPINQIGDDHYFAND